MRTLDVSEALVTRKTPIAKSDALQYSRPSGQLEQVACVRLPIPQGTTKEEIMKCLLLEKPKRINEAENSRVKSSNWFPPLIASLVFLFTMAVSQSTFGQGITGSITGTVTDSSGASIVGATVTVRQIDTNSIRTVTTSGVGSYTVTQLGPGRYSVKVDKTGFE